MTKISIKITFTLLTLLLLITSCGLSKKSQKDIPFTPNKENKIFPKPVGYINDFENILTEQEERELTTLIKKHESKTTDQIAIVTLTSIKPYENISEYAFNLANYWGVGQKDKNNGILIVASKGLRIISIQNGIGIENRLTDTETKRIIDKLIIPEFKENNYFFGLKKGIEAIIHELE